VAWTLYGITVTQLGDLTDTVMTLDAGGTVSVFAVLKRSRQYLAPCFLHLRC